MENLNYIPILVAALIPTIMGFLWYNPKVLGGAWMRELGYTEEDLQKGFNFPLVMGISLVLAFFLSFYINAVTELSHVDCTDTGEKIYTSFHTFKHGFLHGGLMGFLVIMPTFITNGLFERKSYKLIAINVGYWILTVALMGGLLDAWN